MKLEACFIKAMTVEFLAPSFIGTFDLVRDPDTEEIQRIFQLIVICSQ